MAVPRRRGARSAAVAATLSFLFPGAGQAYARRWRPAVLFGVPTLVVVAVLLQELSQGMGHLAARLLDPAVGLTLLVGSILLGAWRVAAVLHASRLGRRTALAWVVVPLLIVAIVAMHGFTFVSAAALIGASGRIASDGDSLLGEVPPDPTLPASQPTAGQTATPASRTPATPRTPAAPGTPTLPPDDEYDDADADEPGENGEPVIDPGPTPGFDMASIDAQADGLVNVMLVGVDWQPGRESRRTDTMIVVSVNSETGDVYMFSFPRDIARFPLYSGGTYQGRLNTFAGYASRNQQLFPEGGIESLGHQLGYLLGVPIDYYAVVDIPGFERVVEAVGGVTIHNEKEIDDRSIDGGEGFYLPAGMHRLSPEDTVKYVRSRKGSSDFARARRQQQVLTAMRREMMKPEKLANLPGTIDAISQVMRTNFPLDRIDELIKLSERVNDQPTGNYVFKYPEWAVHPPKSETNGRWITTLKMDRLRELSLKLFGEKSLYNR